MSSDNRSRRGFLRTATAGIAAAGIFAAPLAGHAEVPAAANSNSFNVMEFGAKADGKTVDSPAVNRAIAAAASAGGGTVFFPAGTYLCYSIRLQSKVTLEFSPGVTVVAADASAGGSYDAAEPNQPWEDLQDYGHNHWHNSLIWGEGLENISIVGPGLIWGKGLSSGREQELPKAELPGVGNKTISLKNCHNVLLRDFAVLHGGHFAVLATAVDNLTIDNLTIDTNRDGIDIDCCHNVHISKCSVNSPWDDAIVPKSSYALGYSRSTEMVTISDCLVTGNFEEGTLLDGTCMPIPESAKRYRTGRIKLGTESNGGFKNITITNCVFDGCHGLALESVDGAILEDVTISNITMRHIFAAPIFIRLGSRMRGPAGVPAGKIRRVRISNVVCSDATSAVSSIISGVPGHAIEDLKLYDITIQHQGGGTREMAELQPPENETNYPDPEMFGSMPAHGFFIRHVDGLEIRDVEIMAQKEDLRPAFVLNDVRRAEFFHVQTPKTAGAPTFSLQNVEDFSVARCRTVPDTQIDKAEKKKL
jgi:polygalacturonase